MTRPLLSVRNLKRTFIARRGLFGRETTSKTHAVDDVSFHLFPGETVGLVGSSGSGKSTLARIILRLIDADGGEIWFDGQLISALTQREIRHYRKDIQVVFQDPFHSLNPRRTIAENIARPLRNFGMSPIIARQRVAELLRMVSLDPTALDRYPHEFSGGQCQRIAIARALSLEPRLLVLDEPVSALDVSIQAQILNLLKDLQHRLGTAYLFVSHDLDIIRYMCDRVLVMYRGQLLETGDSESIHSQPAHPFTQDFLAAILTMAGTDNWIEVAKRFEQADDNLAEPKEIDQHCVYEAVCPHRMPVCQSVRPTLQSLSSRQQVACHLYQEDECDQIKSQCSQLTGL